VTTSASGPPNLSRPIVVAVMMLSLVKHQMGGTEVYARNLIRTLSEHADSKFHFVAVYGNDRHREAGPVLMAAPDDYLTEHVLASIPTGTSHLGKLRLWLATILHSRRIWKEIEHVAGAPIEIVLYPFTAVQPIPPKGMQTVTIIHDLQHRDLPKSFSLGQHIYRRLTYERSARRADAIITVSDFSRNSVIRELRVAPEVVHRIYPGVESSFRGNANYWQSRDSPSPRFLYYPARSLRHKNHQRLFAAVELVRIDFPDVTLCLTGSEAHLLGKLPSFVVHAGNVSSQEVQNFYRDCAGVVFPSTYEGFGFPALEALAIGAPLVLSTSGSLPEVAPSNAIFVDPYSVESIAAGIRLVLLQEHDPEKAREHARRFRWESTTSEILELLWRVKIR
jgi:glycosyltransferase involved in cell wall biosynthesis